MEVHAATEVARCPHCGAHSLHRHGITRIGTQRFRCTWCRRTCTSFTGSVSARIRKRAEFQQYAAKMYRALPTRKDAQRLGVAPSTIWRWRRDLIERLAKRRINKRQRWRGDAVSVAHFMGERRRYWGRISELNWLERRGLGRKWLGEYFNGRPGTMVHFLVGEQMDIRMLDEITIEIGEGAMARPRVPKTFAQVLSPNKTFWLSRGEWLTPVAYQAPSQDEYVYITDPPKRYAPRNVPPPLKRISKATLPSSTQQAALRARDLCNLFCRWADRFRGISLNYLRGYIAWFLEDLALNRLPYTWLYPGGVRWWERGGIVGQVGG